jgi:cytochrome b subunit of formate dehydrogenase
MLPCRSSPSKAPRIIPVSCCFLGGLVLCFSECNRWNLRWLRHTVVIVPAASALLTIGPFMIQVYMAAFGSAIRGDVSVEFARRDHPRWYKEIVESSTSRK